MIDIAHIDNAEDMYKAVRAKFSESKGITEEVAEEYAIMKEIHKSLLEEEKDKIK